MDIMKRTSLLQAAVALATVMTVGFTANAAHAAECQLRNIGFVSAVSDGRLVINAEMWNAATGQQLGYLANATYCSVAGTYNGISPETCKAWLSTAMTAMVANKKIYITAPTCTVGNGVSLSGIGYFGLNN
jgi:hypothetical protein